MEQGDMLQFAIFPGSEQHTRWTVYHYYLCTLIFPKATGKKHLCLVLMVRHSETRFSILGQTGRGHLPKWSKDHLSRKDSTIGN